MGWLFGHSDVAEPRFKIERLHANAWRLFGFDPGYGWMIMGTYESLETAEAIMRGDPAHCRHYDVAGSLIARSGE